ncbi:MAG: 4'-phosphopantetheinyl transferase superfamily protein [Ruminococcus flavefaciens]|nr:4'-phosphopantetheinyl transferase superfamily protein [Ruminococcus flavefaciens]
MTGSNVYVVSNRTEPDSNSISFISHVLPRFRIMKSDRYMRSVDKNNCIISYFLLMYGILKDYGIKTVPEIVLGEYGKPYFADSNICFSISHSDTGVCCGIAECNIGTDIQDINVKFDEIVDMVMTAREKEQIFSSDVPAVEFARFWTLKESICKYYGTGINDRLNRIDFSGRTENVFSYNGLLFRTEKSKDYCISACSKNGFPVFVTKTLEQYIEEYLHMLHTI